jgi:uncharacterized MAPEG superfamily protein
MTPELRLVLWSVALTFIEISVAALAADGQVGLRALAGNRDTLPSLRGFAGRAQRAYQNMLESLPLFIALVLIAQVAGKTSAMTVLGAELFFWSRVAHWLLYLVGIPGLRTLAWAISIAGMVLIFLQLV